MTLLIPILILDNPPRGYSVIIDVISFSIQGQEI